MYSRSPYSNEYYIPKIGFDTPENEHFKVCLVSVPSCYRIRISIIIHAFITTEAPRLQNGASFVDVFGDGVTKRKDSAWRRLTPPKTFINRLDMMLLGVRSFFDVYMARNMR